MSEWELVSDTLLSWERRTGLRLCTGIQTGNDFKIRATVCDSKCTCNK